MDNLEGVRRAIATNPKRCVFVSCSSEANQGELAGWFGLRLKAHGYIPILQDARLKHGDFMLAMDAAPAPGPRVLALMSREYLASQHCLKEATAALDDRRNRSRRLVPLSIGDCRPKGLLRYVDRIDVTAVWRTRDANEMSRVLLAALDAPADLEAKYLMPSAMDASQVLHPNVLMHDEEAFVGREEELARLRDLLWRVGSSARTLTGQAGIGKTTLARAYAFLQRDEYCAVWWLRAETTKTLIDDLIDLGTHYISGLGRWADREAAARKALQIIATHETRRPWLLVFDNAPHSGIVRRWRPEQNAHVLVTSRNPGWEAAVSLDVLTPKAAVEFLCDTADRNHLRDREEAAALAEQLECLPLALAHAAGACRVSPHTSFADYGRRLTEIWAHNPDAGVTHSRCLLSVHATFSIALDAIVSGDAEGARPPCPEAETVMGVLAHLAPDQVPEFLLAPLYASDGAAMSATAFERALAELATTGLVDWGEFEDGAPHLNVHRLVQEIVRARLAIKGRAGEVAALTTRAAESTFDATGSLDVQTRNDRWLPQAIEALRRAPRGGPEAWHTLWTQLRIGDLYVMRGWSLGQALVAYLDGLALANDLAKADPGNAGSQFDLSVSLEKIGNVLAEQGNLPAARNVYQASLAIRERLAKSDIGNAGWQRGLSVSHVTAGDVIQAQGNLESYRASHAIFKRLAKADPGNARWQRGLSVSHIRIGDVMRAQGNLPGALECYRASNAISERLTNTDRGNGQWQRDLALSHERVAEVLARQGARGEAAQAFEKGHAIIMHLCRRSPNNTVLPKDLAWFEARLAVLGR